MSRLISRYESYDTWKTQSDLDEPYCGYGDPWLDEDGLDSHIIHLGKWCWRGLCERCGDPMCDHFCHTGESA